MRRLIALPVVALVIGIGVAVGCSNNGSAGPAPTPVARVTVTLANTSLATGQTTQATAVTADSLGAALTGRSVTWSSSAVAVATVSTSGLVTAVAPGSASITATSEGKSGFATVTVVSPAPDTGCVSRNFSAASDLVGCIKQDGLWAHMVAFQRIADANPGSDGHPSRNSGEPGYLASVNYAANLLRAAGYRVTIQQYNYDYSGYSSVPLLNVVSPTVQTFALGPDFNLAGVGLSSGQGDVTAQIQPAAGIVIPAPAAQNTSASGCTAADFVGFVPGRIALIQRGTCTFNVKINLAEAAGAAGVIVFNEGSPGSTTATTCGVSVPAVPIICLASFAVGQSLYNQALQGPTMVRIRIQPVREQRPDYNLIADSPYGDTNHVVVVDAHLDAIYGAGMLDNASGSATILEIALKMATTHAANQLRYIWFGGEETGLHGSFFYTHALSAGDLGRIVFDVDADVTATPNYVYAIADPANGGWSGTVVTASQVGNNYFASYFNAAGLPFDDWNNVGTDSYSFAGVGVPNTGILTAQDCCKSAADVAKFGGFTGNYEGNVPGTDGGCVDRPSLWCDNLSNNDPVVLTTVSKAFASVVFNLANNATLGASSLRRPAMAPGMRAASRATARMGEGPIR
jgi:hypothetical protein